MERIRELLARIGSSDNPLTDDEWGELRTLIADEYARLDAIDATPDVVAEMQEIVEAAETVAQAEAEQAQALADAEAQRDELRQRMHVVNNPEDGEGGEGAGDGEGEGGEGGDGDADGGEGDGGEGSGDAASGDTRRATPAAVGQTGQRAAASSTRRASMTAMRRHRPEGDSPEREIPSRDGHTLTTVMVASADVRGFGIGQPLPTWDEVGKAFAAKLSSIQRAPVGKAKRGQKVHGTELVLVASAAWEYPDDRKLVDTDPEGNAAKLDLITHPRAVVASGGICAPVAVDYDVPVWSVADRPLRDSLPAFGATRGGLRFITPPTITGLAGATTIWTHANDASPSSPATKPVLRINCGSETTVYVDAIPTRVEVGNFMGRFSPEWTGANLQLAVAAAARIAETNLLTQVLANSTVVTSGKLLGASRDIVATLDQAVMAIRYRNRLPETIRLRAWLPAWARDMFRADRAREIAHDQDGPFDPFAVTDAQIDAWFAARNVSVTWFIDYLGALSNVNGSGVSTVAQYPGALTSGAAISTWPTTASTGVGMLWFLFAEGTFQFLDGGQLDLGIVRDSILDSTNDYETFIETFEGVADRGLESLAIYSNVRPNGLSAGTVDTSSY